MKLIPYGSNQNLVEINKDTEIFYSYKTAVAGKIKGKYYRTNKWYSQTTTRHINNFPVSLSLSSVLINQTLLT